MKIIADAKNSIRLASINIERNNHLNKVISFLKKFKPDVLCLQEFLETDLPFFEKELGLHGAFMPETRLNLTIDDPTTPLVTEGVAILASVPLRDVRTYYYKGTPDVLPVYSKAPDGFVTTNCALLALEVFWGGQVHTFITTHFTWSKDGIANKEQRENMGRVLSFLEREPAFVLSGDFNAPRGGEIFGMLAAKYKDNIPPCYTTSIDKNLHRAGDLQLMVDGLFSTPQYEVSDVKLNDNVSDHMAITALIKIRKYEPPKYAK